MPYSYNFFNLLLETHYMDHWLYNSNSFAHGCSFSELYFTSTTVSFFSTPHPVRYHPWAALPRNWRERGKKGQRGLFPFKQINPLISEEHSHLAPVPTCIIIFMPAMCTSQSVPLSGHSATLCSMIQLLKVASAWTPPPWQLHNMFYTLLEPPRVRMNYTSVSWLCSGSCPVQPAHQ